MRKLYMAVTKDHLELPIAVADSPHELAEMIGVKANNISSSLTRTRNRPEARTKYREIIWEDEDDG